MRRLRFGDVVSDEAGVVEARVEEMGAMVEVGMCDARAVGAELRAVGWGVIIRWEACVGVLLYW